MRCSRWRYVSHPRCCKCPRFANRLALTESSVGCTDRALGGYPLQSPGLARILRRLSVSRHFLRFPQ
ncbi:hypothetical protein BZL43_15265 [Pseudomonas sp. PICF141]|nr:hypothetical protein BZL43_15265 [Pseudomonas sp. PICF141]